MQNPSIKNKSNFAIFASYYKPHMPLFITDLVCALGIAAVDLSFPLASRYALNTLLPNDDFSAFFALIAILGGAFLLRFFFTFIVTYWGHLLGVRIEADIRSDLFSHMQTLSYSFYDKNRTGHLMSRVTGDLFEITELAHHGPEDVFISFVTLVGAFVIMWSIHWQLTLLVFATIPLIIIFAYLRRKSLKKSSARMKETLSGVNGEVESAISGMRTSKAFANEAIENEKFENSNLQFKTAKRSYYFAMGIFHASMELFLGILPVIVIATGGYFFMTKEINYIDLFTFSLYVSTFVSPIRKLSNFSELFVQGMAGFNRFVELMKIDPEVSDKPTAVTTESVEGDIELENVSFKYESADLPVITNLNLSIKKGETIAIVGPSGGGKSTLCRLIPRFYDVTDGSVMVDGIDVRDMKQAELRAHIGIVAQDVFLFAGTIRDNIRYGKPDATEAEIVEAAKKAEIYEDIIAMPEGLDSYVGERGVMLSGGQKQRISIARIFLKNPPVLILDEATSALDSVTEMKIQSAFDRLSEGRTTIIIAHRLSTIRTANRIVVIDENRICEEGTHAELLEAGGRYAALCKAQITA